LGTGRQRLIGFRGVEHFDRQDHRVTALEHLRQVVWRAGDTTLDSERLKRSTKIFAARLLRAATIRRYTSGSTSNRC